MSRPFTQQELNKAAEGDLKTLSELDSRGFIIGPEETPEKYTERLKVFEKNLKEMDTELKEKNCLTVEDLSFPASEKIPQESFNPATKITENLYDFKSIKTQDAPVADGDIGFDPPSFDTQPTAEEENDIHIVNMTEAK